MPTGKPRSLDHRCCTWQGLLPPQRDRHGSQTTDSATSSSVAEFRVGLRRLLISQLESRRVIEGSRWSSSQLSRPCGTWNRSLCRLEQPSTGLVTAPDRSTSGGLTRHESTTTGRSRKQLQIAFSDHRGFAGSLRSHRRSTSERQVFRDSKAPAF